MSFRKDYSQIDTKWAITEATNPFNIWTHNRAKTETIDNNVRLAKLGGLVVRRSMDTYTPSELQHIAKYGPLVNLAFGEIAYLTLSHELQEAAVARSGESDPIYKDLCVLESTHGFDMRWAIPVRAMLPVIDLTDIDITAPYFIPAVNLNA